MKKNISIILVLCATLFNSQLYAGSEKVVDSSGKEPKWIYGMQKDYIITSGEASTIDEAQEKAMLSLKKQILSSIAENVKTESSFTTVEKSDNNRYDMATLYLQKIETKGANIPFLQEISTSKAEEYYWEKLKRDKNTFVYRYHIKYPFSQFDLMRMADDFRMREEQLDRQLDDFANDDFSSYSTVEEMEKQALALKKFEQTLMPEDEARRTVCKTIQSAYRKQLEGITLKLLSCDTERLVFQLYYGSNPVTSDKKPQLRTNCLTGMAYSREGQKGVVTYDYQTSCYPDEQNWIEVIFNFNSKKIGNKFYIKN